VVPNKQLIVINWEEVKESKGSSKTVPPKRARNEVTFHKVPWPRSQQSTCRINIYTIRFNSERQAGKVQMPPTF